MITALNAMVRDDVVWADRLGRLHDRKVGGFFAFQHAAGVDTSLPISIEQTWPVAHQATSVDVEFERVNGGNRVTRGEHHEQWYFAHKEGIGADKQRTGSVARKRQWQG
jgi:hypothetical protein